MALSGCHKKERPEQGYAKRAHGQSPTKRRLTRPDRVGKSCALPYSAVVDIDADMKKLPGLPIHADEFWIKVKNQKHPAMSREMWREAR